MLQETCLAGVTIESRSSHALPIDTPAAGVCGAHAHYLCIFFLGSFCVHPYVAQAAGVCGAHAHGSVLGNSGSEAAIAEAARAAVAANPDLAMDLTPAGMEPGNTVQPEAFGGAVGAPLPRVMNQVEVSLKCVCP